METDFSWNTSLVFSIASLAISVIAIVMSSLIAWTSPHRSEKIKKTSQARQIHFDKIKKNCLELLVNGVDNVTSHFRIDESTLYGKQSLLDLMNDRELKETMDVKLWVSIINSSSSYGNEIIFLDNVLYNDLDNHYPEIKKQIGIVQKYIDESYPIYHEKFNVLVLKLFDELERSISVQQNEQNKISMAVAVALNCIFHDDIKSWPSLYNVSSKNGTLPVIKEIINKPEITELTKPLKEISKKSLSLLSDLRNSLNQIIRYEGELKGKCEFLQA